MYVHVGLHTPQHACRGKKTTSWSQFSPSIFMWVPGIKSRSLGSHKHLDWLSYPTSLGLSRVSGLSLSVVAWIL